MSEPVQPPATIDPGPAQGVGGSPVVDEENGGAGRGGKGPRIALALAVAFVIAGGIALLVGGSSKSSSASNAKATSYAGLALAPPKPEPPLALRNYLGQKVNVDQFRGKAVLVTFLYTHCTTDCPLIASDLHTALTLMGPKNAEKVQIVAVSVDPRGDNPTDAAAFLKAHQLTGHMLYLLGSLHELGSAWSAWGVGSERDASNPETINHSALVYGITASGKVTTIYAASMKPSEVAHDVPLLAAS